MSDTPDIERREGEGGGDWSLAGELALGVLEGAERRDAEARVAADPVFAAMVDDWHARLGDLAAETAPEAPPDGAWAAIDRRLFPDAGDDRPGLWNNLRFWRWLAAGAAAVAAACVALLLVVTVPQPGAPLVATLQSAGAGPVYLVHVDPQSGNVVAHVLESDADPSHVPELWVIAADGVPHSLGVMRRTGETQFAVPPPLRPVTAAGATLAVSLEPAGGSPTGKPTGPVIATGKIGES